MNLRDALASNFNFQNLIIKGAYVVCIAIVFEIIALLATRRVDKMTAPLMTNDTGREHNWRLRRRATLKQTPRAIVRTICYGVAVILVFDVFGVPVLPLSLAVGAIIALFGSAMLPLLRDAAQGYALLAEDTIAVGDVVNLDGREGVVERFTLRGTWLRDKEGRAHALSNRDIKNVTVVTRRAEDAGAVNRDPNALPPVQRRTK
ncbi:MAG TPA: mechanosensitive ion channel domain-containing protein [Abditibacteriaceae bacterium]|jgi:small conductance mechanosensitive channel